jgi:hypothetical protein
MHPESSLLCAFCDVSVPLVVLDRACWMPDAARLLPHFIAHHMEHYGDDLPPGAWLIIVADGDPRAHDCRPSMYAPRDEPGPD